MASWSAHWSYHTKYVLVGHHILYTCVPEADSIVSQDALLSRPTELVQLAFDNSRHFGLNTPQGLAESASIVPNDGLITDPTDNATYTVSMFHQLGCLSVIANEITRDTTQQPKPSRLGRHCLNYLRQMIECRGDTQLESFQSTNSKAPVDIHTTYVCRDWGKLYDQFNELNNA